MLEDTRNEKQAESFAFAIESIVEREREKERERERARSLTCKSGTSFLSLVFS
jgi:hypothetical protein